MAKNFRNFFGLLTDKAEGKPGDGAVSAMEESRGGQPKAYIPNFFYRPPFGYPRYKDLFYFRKLAASIYVDMCETAIIDEVCAIEYEIVAEDSSGNEVPGKEKEVEIVKEFFENPNTNKESWEHVVKMMLPDLLELNSGIMVKTFNAFGKMVEIVARDGIAFTKNPDVYGMYTHRADLILIKDIYDDNPNEPSPYQAENGYPLLQGYLTSSEAQEEGAYFQYGFNTGAKPVPFGKREIVWFEKKLRTDNLYGRSAMEILAKTVQTLIYAVEHNLEYFSDNSIPPGVMGLEGMSTADLKAFGEQWVESQKKADELGNWKKVFHKLAMVNKKVTFERLGFTNAELELIESQKWWSKMVWASFGMTATEMGFTEDAKGSANQIVQSSIAKKRIIYPLLKLIAYHVNKEIIPEFGFEGIRYKYKIFDADEETKKWTLYKLQTESGLKSINEIRATEGLDDVEWGDDAPKNWSPNQGMNVNMTDPRQTESNRINQDNQNQRDQALVKPKNPKDKDKDKKALDTSTPLTLRPGEEMDDKKLRRAIVEVLDRNKKKVIEVLESQVTKEPIIAIKSVDDVPGMVKEIFSIFSLKTISDAVIKSDFDSGWDASEKKIERNVNYNEHALTFLQDMTFDNIKGMTEEVANDLKAELERGIVNGEGITKLTKRVDKVFDVGENRAGMIARTETNRANNNGKLLAMKGSGLDMEKKWVTHEDDRTSPICMRLDGQTVGINEMFKDSSNGWEGQSPPSHVNCRSTIIFMEKEEEDVVEQLNKEKKMLDEKIKIKLAEKEAEIKERKSNLLKRLEEDLDERD